MITAEEEEISQKKKKKKFQKKINNPKQIINQIHFKNILLLLSNHYQTITHFKHKH